MRIFHFASVRSVLFVLVVMASAGASFGQVAISVTIAPPPLPVYEQPLCPGEDYIWIPGYWAWDLVDEDYYWVPGTWVLPPEVGLLWTPPYWAWVNTGFVFFDEAGSGPSAPGALGCQCSENARIGTEAPATNHPTSAKTRHGVAEAADPTAGSKPGSAQASFTASLELFHRTAGLDLAC